MNIAYDYTREYDALLNFCGADASLYNSRPPPSGSVAILYATYENGVAGRSVWGAAGLGFVGIILAIGAI